MKKLLFALLTFMFMSLSFSVMAQEKLTYSAKVAPELKAAVAKQLNEKLTKFYEEFKYQPYLHYAFIDLNRDGKDEIVVKFVEEYAFRDSYNNVDHHIFAQTSKGLIEILHVPAWEIKIDYPRAKKLRNVIAYSKPNDKQTVYVWNGNDKYVKN